MSGYDAVVIGAGHNGLVAAATLARKGCRVLILERRDEIGGMAAGGHFSDGTPMPRIAHLLYNLSPKVLTELGFGSGGPVKTRALPTVALDPGGRHVILADGRAAFADGSDHPEALAYCALTDRLRRFGGILARLADEPPPKLEGMALDLASLKRTGPLAALGWDLRKLGRSETREFLKILLSNAYDVILDEMAEGPLAGALAADAVRGVWAGPRSPGTLFSLLYRIGRGGGAALPIGGMGAFCEALASTARASGVSIRTGAEVAALLLHGDRVRGVRLLGGEEIAAKVVLMASGPLAAVRIAGPAEYDIESVRRLRNLRCKGTAAKINLLVSEAPGIDGLSDDHAAGRLVLAPSADYVERAFDAVKYGELPDAPVIEAVIPTLIEPALRKAGKHVMSLVVQYVPRDIPGGWTDAARAKVLDATLRALEPVMPELRKSVAESEVLTPSDIEKLTGAPGGHWHHAELSIDQLLTVRPVNGLSCYRFGPEGYYLCGAGAHPGGDVMGSAGRNAALAALADGLVG
jgi:phytoene dehydrogenase-like protein